MFLNYLYAVKKAGNFTTVLNMPMQLPEKMTEDIVALTIAIINVTELFQVGRIGRIFRHFWSDRRSFPKSSRVLY